MLKLIKSPLCPRAFDPRRVPPPEREYDLAHTLQADRNRCGFETKAQARTEDGYRATSLIKWEGDHAVLGKLLSESTAKHQLLLSCASSFYFRVCRRRLLGNVHKHFHDRGYPDSAMSTFHIINKKWFVPEGHLKDFPAAKIKQNFTRYLECAGVISASGLMFAGLHGSFDDTGYQLHYHGIVAGDKLDALRGMRKKFGFSSSADIYRPIVIEKLNDPPRQISYCLQSWWPYEPADGSNNGKRQRLPEAAHAEFLMWMSKQNLMDLVVMSGMRIGKGGLVSTQRKTD